MVRGLCRVWVAPYEDIEGNYHQASQVYSVVQKRALDSKSTKGYEVGAWEMIKAAKKIQQKVNQATTFLNHGTSALMETLRDELGMNEDHARKQIEDYLMYTV